MVGTTIDYFANGSSIGQLRLPIVHRIRTSL